VSEGERPGFELPLLLAAAFRAIVDELHAELARRGHADARPLHGFVLQAVGPGTTAVDLARRLGVTKQAAAKTVARLERQGYVRRRPSTTDRRSQQILITDRGTDMLRASAEIFEHLRARRGALLGDGRLQDLEDDLEQIAGDASLRALLDLPGWLARE
jgi:DNA-binding MarR family transcriptional regulator